MPQQNDRRIALFLDFENLVTNTGVTPATFDLQPAIDRLLEKGKVIFRRAYADWSRFKEAKGALHEFGVELFDVPPSTRAGKNGADMRLVIDALELCYARDYIDAFVIGSGDSDFCPLAYKLRENNRLVIGLGYKESTSRLFVKACDEFIYLKPRPASATSKRKAAAAEEAAPARSSRRAKPAQATAKSAAAADKPAAGAPATPAADKAPASPPETSPATEAEAAKATRREAAKATKGEAAATGSSRDAKAAAPTDAPAAEDGKEAAETDAPAAGTGGRRSAREKKVPVIAREVVQSLLARATGPINPSLIKETIVRKEPDFDEREHGFSTFSKMLEAMEKEGLLKRQQIKGRQWYVVPPDLKPIEGAEAEAETEEASGEPAQQEIPF